MQDKAITQIGKWELKKVSNKEPFQLYIENMFPGKENYNMVVIMFFLTKEDEEYGCRYDGIDLENVNKENFLKYAYRKGSARGGDVTFTTKLGDIEKKINSLANTQIKNFIDRLKKTTYSEELAQFEAIQSCFKENITSCKRGFNAYL